MAIRFKYDLATVAPPSNDLTRKFGQSLVLQQQQQKYSGQQAGYDRLFNAYKQQNQNAFAWNQAADNRVFQAKQQEAQNNFLTGRDKTQFEQRQQEAEAERQRGFLEEGRKQQSGYITDAIKNGEYDPATARKLQQNLVAEAEALGNPQLDATQRAEVLAKIRAERATLTANRMERPPEPSDQEKFNKGIVVDPVTGMRYRPNSKGDYEPLPPGEQQQPKSAVEAFKADPKTGDKYREKAEARLMGADDEMPQVDSGEVGEDGTKKKRDMTPQEFQREVNKLASELWGIDNPQPEKPTGFGTSSAAYYNALDSEAKPPAADIPIAPPDPGQPPSPAEMPRLGAPPGAPQPAGMPESGPLPLSSNTTSQQAQAPQQVKVGGKPLAVTPGTLTPQETEARGQLMELPREQRISALMPYDPELKGKTLEQLLEDPETKAGYEEMTKQGLTTGNYREDMLGHLDEMLQHNVLNAAGQSKQSAYVGMRADDITDSKAKAEVAKLPRPKSKNDREAVRSGQLYVDPEGVIRARA